MKRRSLRKKVFTRDRGVCHDCNLDCELLRKRMATICGIEEKRAAWHLLTEAGFREGSAFWESEHDLALDEGGLDELGNLVTRCRPCHRAKTAEQAGRKARQRKLIGRKFLASRKQTGIVAPYE